MRMIVVARCIERIGDNAVDIGEQTAFLVTGEFHGVHRCLPLIHHSVTERHSRHSLRSSTDRALAEPRTGLQRRQRPIHSRGRGCKIMKKSLAAVARARRASLVASALRRAAAAPAKSRPASLVGAGATFPFPLISKWIPAGRRRPTTSTSRTRRRAPARGIAAITARTVDFGASDAPLSPSQLDGVQGLRRDPVGAVRDLDPVQPARPERPAAGSTARRSPRSTSARSRTGTTRRSGRSTPAATCPTRRSRRSSARTARARRTTSPSTSRPSAGRGSTRSASTRA